MKHFIGDDFLLNTEVAKRLYNNYANMKLIPVIDYHCHINPKEIWEDRQFDNITQVWLGGDHYKWRQMRTNGIDESFITGDASDYEKFEKWAEIMPRLIGNPLYIWSHYELKFYFGYEGNLNPRTCKEVWDMVNEKLARAEYSARNLIRMSNVKLICTTDDPIDDLHYHELIAADESFDVKVLPAFRPDKAMNIEKEDFPDYIRKLEMSSNIEINSFSRLIEALAERMDYFANRGCSVADHGLLYVMYKEASDEEIESIFAKAMDREAITELEEQKFKTAFMLAIARQYHKRNWVMQLHYGCKRDNNSRMYKELGPDTGFDEISTYTPSDQLSDYLNALEITNQLPKTILYSLNPQDNAAIGTIIGCFQGDGERGKIQQGSAWWFNDHYLGMQEQMKSLASLSSFGNFIGMLTDSRSFLSYTRHDYFRRIVCELMGNWVENGEYPDDDELLAEIVKGISYNNSVRYFGFDLEFV